MNTIESLYDALGFCIAEIDDQDYLFYELDESRYATVTDEDGKLPESTEVPIIFAVYTEADDAFLWSVTLPSSKELEALMLHHEDVDELLAVLQDVRAESIAKYDAMS